MKKMYGLLAAIGILTLGSIAEAQQVTAGGVMNREQQRLQTTLDGQISNLQAIIDDFMTQMLQCGAQRRFLVDNSGSLGCATLWQFDQATDNVTSLADAEVDGRLTAANATISNILNAGRVDTDELRVENGGDATIAGDTNVGGNVTADMYLYNSDRRLKDNVVDADKGLETVLAIRPVRYTMVDDGREELGVIAQELELLLPELVHTKEDGMKSVDYARLVVPLVKAVQELTTRLETLEADQ